MNSIFCLSYCSATMSFAYSCIYKVLIVLYSIAHANYLYTFRYWFITSAKWTLSVYWGSINAGRNLGLFFRIRGHCLGTWNTNLLIFLGCRYRGFLSDCSSSNRYCRCARVLMSSTICFFCLRSNNHLYVSHDLLSRALSHPLYPYPFPFVSISPSISVSYSCYWSNFR